MSMLTRTLFILMGLVIAGFAMVASIHMPNYEVGVLKWVAAYGFLFFVGLAFASVGITKDANWATAIFGFVAAACLYVITREIDGPLVANMLFGAAFVIAIGTAFLAKRDAEKLASVNVL